MLKENSRLFVNLLFTVDLVVIALSWVGAYYLRFYGGVYPFEGGVPDVVPYLVLLAPLELIWAICFRGFGLYRPRRLSTHASEFAEILKASGTGLLFLVTLGFFLRKYEFSRLVYLLFFFMSVASVSLGRYLFREFLRYLRRTGRNLRHALVVGTGTPAVELIKRLDAHPEVGIKVVGVLAPGPGLPVAVGGVPVLGDYGDVARVIGREGIDILFVALSGDEHHRAPEILKKAGDEAVDIKIVPDVYEFAALGGGVEELEGLPLMSLRDSPMYGWNGLVKRAADVAVASTALVAASPVMLIIAMLVKLTSPGPVLYRQERISIGGDTFEMLKFRSMVDGAEDSTGAVWAERDDGRRTTLGALLRKTSLDELPQLINVIRGDMSLVGPRPERPVFIEEFRRLVPGYKLRHRMKAGITGWAQVNGWRGNTDIKKRVEHDLYYIDNWSLGFDLKILVMTLWRGLVNRNAY